MATGSATTTRKLRTSPITPELFFLVFGILVGGILCITIPFGAGFDEEAHLARIWEISGLRFLPNQSGPNNTTAVPRAFFDLSYQRRYFLSPADDLLRPPLLTQAIDRKEMFSYMGRSLYPPISYLPQALIAGLGWRLFDLPVVPVAIVERMAGLVIYILGTFFAIRWIPLGKWVMVLLAISPMALFQAATLNGDGYTNTVCFAIIGYSLKLLENRQEPITRNQALGLAGLVVAVGFAKQGAFVVLAMLVVLHYRRFAQRKWFALIWVAAIAAILITLGWSALIFGRTGLAGSDSSADLLGHIRLALANPGDFVSLLVRGVPLSIDRYFHEWVGVYGHWLGSVPQAIYILYPLALLVLLGGEDQYFSIKMITRLQMIGAFLAASGAMIVFFYLLYYQVGIYNIRGVQGRYFTSLAPMLFIPLAALLPTSQRVARFIRRFGLFLGCFVVALYGFGLFSTYYSECSSTLYTGEACYQPVYKNIDKGGSPSVEINQGQIVTQTFSVTCGMLEGAQVWIQSTPPDPQGSLHFDLFDNEDRLLASQVTVMKDIPAASYFLMKITQPIAPKEGATFKIRLSSVDTPPGKGVKLAYSDSNQYQPGELKIDQNTIGADLIFKYMCVNSWQQVLGKTNDTK